MVDDHVHIAHNCKIKRAAIVACAEVSGPVRYEEAWISPNSSVMQKILLGRMYCWHRCCCLKVDSGDSIYIGNPAKPLGKIKKNKLIIWCAINNMYTYYNDSENLNELLNSIYE